ncbi:MAG: COX15/CtaA family protein [Porticoccaceae bacterium]|nr:COX15/CtaA family protein [Porticoccaceae bacterium]
MTKKIPYTRKPGYRLALLAFCCALVVVMLGAFTRLVDAGLGCPDWPGCYGHLTWPKEDHDIARAEARFPDAPVETDKTWPEMVHRYFASGLGLLIVLIAVKAWPLREQRDYPFRLPIFLLFVVVWQGLFGMWTVTLKLWPQVVTMHLLGGMTVLSLLWLLIIRLSDTHWRFASASYQQVMKLKPWLVTGIVLVAMQIILGGWTTSNYAAFACPDLPTCHNSWIPPMDLARGFDIFQTIGPNYLGGQLENDARVAIHYVHRMGALVVTLYLLLLALRALFIADRRVAAMVWIVMAALGLQILLGITNVLMKIPLAVAVAHNAGAGILMLTLVTFAARVWMALPENKEQE